MFVDEYGIGVMAERGLDNIDLTEERLSRFTDMLMVKLTKTKISNRNLAKIFNVDEKTVRRRLSAVPAEAKVIYERFDMGRLESA